LNDYIEGGGLDEMLEKYNTTSSVFYHQDGLGSTARLTNGSGNVIESYYYDIYGTPTIKNASGTVLTATAYGNRFLFAGREYLANVNLYDFRNRMYSPQWGRWLSRDPIEENGGIDLYSYVLNAPVNLLDLWGLCCDQQKADLAQAKENLSLAQNHIQELESIRGSYVSSFMADKFVGNMIKIQAIDQAIQSASSQRQAAAEAWNAADKAYRQCLKDNDDDSSNPPPAPASAPINIPMPSPQQQRTMMMEGAEGVGGAAAAAGIYEILTN
jgi:RHS repeat-associated protein